MLGHFFKFFSRLIGGGGEGQFILLYLHSMLCLCTKSSFIKPDDMLSLFPRGTEACHTQSVTGVQTEVHRQVKHSVDGSDMVGWG